MGVNYENGWQQAMNLRYEIEEWLDLLQKNNIRSKTDLRSRRRLWVDKTASDIVILIKDDLLPSLQRIMAKDPEQKRELSFFEIKILLYLKQLENGLI